MDDDGLEEIVERCHRDLATLLNGDASPWRENFSHRADVTLGNPFGPFVCGLNEVMSTAQAAADRYRDGEVVAFERVATYVGEDLACSELTRRALAQVAETPVVVEVPHATWNQATWTMQGGIVTSFAGDGNSSIRDATAADLALDVKPDELRRKRRRSYEFNYADLSKQIAGLERKGLNATEYTVDLNYKLSAPFSGLVAIVLALLSLVIASARPVPAHAWSFSAHKFIADRVIDVLPPEIRPFFQKFRSTVVEHSIDPDTYRTIGFTEEPPRHFLDMDAYGPFPFRDLPHDYNEATQRRGADL